MRIVVILIFLYENWDPINKFVLELSGFQTLFFKHETATLLVSQDIRFVDLLSHMGRYWLDRFALW